MLVSSFERQRSFAVHEGLLKERSEFFTNALKPERFKEGIERVVSMPEDDPDIFAVYIQHLYRPDLMSVDRKLNGEEIEQKYMCLADLYVLAEKLIDTKTKEHVSHALKSLMQKSVISLAVVFPIYDGTLKNDPARALIVDWFTRYAKGGWFKNMDVGEHEQFFRDLA